MEKWPTCNLSIRRLSPWATVQKLAEGRSREERREMCEERRLIWSNLTFSEERNLSCLHWKWNEGRPCESYMNESVMSWKAVWKYEEMRNGQPSKSWNDIAVRKKQLSKTQQKKEMKRKIKSFYGKKTLWRRRTKSSLREITIWSMILISGNLKKISIFWSCTNLRGRREEREEE